MKRSEINQQLRSAITLCKKNRFPLPPYAFWSPEEWTNKGHEYDEIRDNLLGWDVTDFGSGKFHKIGLTLFTLRNGNLKKKKYTKPYCEKLLIVDENQITPAHFHWYKIEDIINRGGGNLLFKVYNADKHEKLADTPVRIVTDGFERKVRPGTIIRLKPGESITLFQKVYHKFWAEEGKGRVMAIEVSRVNDDKVDNRFIDLQPRFPKIKEDEKPLYLLCHEYPPAPVGAGKGFLAPKIH